MIGYIQIKGKPDRHKQSGKEIQQEAAYRKRADYIVILSMDTFVVIFNVSNKKRGANRRLRGRT